MRSPLSDLPFPVWCAVCNAGPFRTPVAVDEHISEDHLPEAVWSYAHDNMRPSKHPEGARKKSNV